MKKLIKSYKFWTCLAGAVGLLFVAINDTLGLSINAYGVEQIIMSVCSILVVFGIVNKPKLNAKENQPNEKLVNNFENKNQNKNDETTEDFDEDNKNDVNIKNN